MVTLVAQHAAHPYAVGGLPWPVSNPERSLVLEPFVMVNPAYFLGLFFLLAGYFTVPSCGRRGAAGYLRERVVRLGPPLLFFSLLVYSAVFYLWQGRGRPLGEYLLNTYLLEHRLEFGHLWFLLHLLVYAVVFAAWRARIATRETLPVVAESDRSVLPGHIGLITYALLLGGICGLVRIWWPAREWRHFLGVIPFEPAHLPGYLSLFWLGILAYRGAWFERWPRQLGKVWLGIGLFAVLLRCLYGWSAALLPRLVTLGGADWRTFVWSLLEAVIAVGLSVGLVVWFRDHAGRESRWLRGAAAATYAVYLSHLAVVGGLQWMLQALALDPLVKFLLVAGLGIPLSFGLGHLLRGLPLLRRIL